MDEWRLEAGDDWRGDIGEGIMAAKVILFIVSPKSVEVESTFSLIFFKKQKHNLIFFLQSDWCLKELRLGIQHGKIVSLKSL